MPIAQAVGLGAAVDYLTGARHGRDRRARAGDHRRTRWSGCTTCHGLTIIGPDTPVDRGGAVALHPGGHPPARRGPGARRSSASRSGPATTAPSRSATAFGIPATTRASFYLYTTRDEVDALVRGLDEVRKVFG